MSWFRKKATEKANVLLVKYFNEAQLWRKSEEPLDVLSKLVACLRPFKVKENVSYDLNELIDFIKNNPLIRNELVSCINVVFNSKKCDHIFTEAGILQDSDFIYEIRKRLVSKLIPEQPEKNTLEYVLNQLFYHKSDGEWISQIPWIQLLELFDLLSSKSMYDSVDDYSLLSETLASMNLLAQRMSGRALEADIMRMVPEYKKQENPFSAFEDELQSIVARVMVKNRPHYIDSSDLSYKHLNVLYKQCEDFVDTAFYNSHKYGITLKVNQKLLRIRLQLKRIKVLFKALIVDHENQKKENTLQLVVRLIQYNSTKNNIANLIGESTQLISYEITQHTAKTGEKYITESKKEYDKMLYTALGGGFIVGIMCIIKVMLSKYDVSDFGHAVLYSLNYSIGFTLIYLFGFTLATKQPAMTAAALVTALEKGLKKQSRPEHKHMDFALLFARVFRTQFIAFVGNVVMAFPVALAGIWLIDHYYDYNIASKKWEVLVTDLSPVHSMAIVHSAIAGVFLFLSGIIAGYVANRDKHFQMPNRIAEHPRLKRVFGKKWALKLSLIYEKKWPGIVSNMWFGIFMGSIVSVGIFLGLNLDIRHITFASGNLALAAYGSGFDLTFSMVFWGVLGIGVIGFVNFIVSFTLSLGLAFRSRNIPIRELKIITLSVIEHFKYSPYTFFFPPKEKVSNKN